MIVNWCQLQREGDRLLLGGRKFLMAEIEGFFFQNFSIEGINWLCKLDTHDNVVAILNSGTIGQSMWLKNEEEIGEGEDERGWPEVVAPYGTEGEERRSRLRAGEVGTKKI